MSSTCDGEFTLSADCATSSEPKVLLWGDSYAMHLYQGLNASNEAIELRQITKSSCSPILGISLLDFSDHKGFEFAERCIDFNSSAYEWLQSSRFICCSVILLDWVDSESFITSDRKIYKPNVEFALRMFEQTVQQIESLGVGVIVVSPTPRSSKNNGKRLTKISV